MSKKRRKKKKKERNIIRLTFGENTYVKDDETDFVFAWLHPIISGRLCIKYCMKWMISNDNIPKVYRYYIFFFTLVLRAFLWMYIGTVIGVLSNDKPDEMRLLTEIPMTVGMAFLSMIGLLMVLRIVISFLELIRLFKEDNLFLYGLGVTFVYGFIVMILLGNAFFS